MTLFTLPIDEIILNEKKSNHYMSNHYSYHNGEYMIEFSHLHGEFPLTISYDDGSLYGNQLKLWVPHSITKSSMKSLENRVNKFLEKNNVVNKFYNVGDCNFKFYKELLKEVFELGIDVNKKIEITFLKGLKSQISLTNLKEDEIIITDNKDINHISFCSIDVKSEVKIYQFLEEILSENRL